MVLPLSWGARSAGGERTRDQEGEGGQNKMIALSFEHFFPLCLYHYHIVIIRYASSLRIVAHFWAGNLGNSLHHREDSILFPRSIFNLHKKRKGGEGLIDSFSSTNDRVVILEQDCPRMKHFQAKNGAYCHLITRDPGLWVFCLEEGRILRDEVALFHSCIQYTTVNLPTATGMRKDIFLYSIG